MVNHNQLGMVKSWAIHPEFQGISHPGAVDSGTGGTRLPISSIN